MTFAYTGAEQPFVVAAGVTQISVTAYGAQGGGGNEGFGGVASGMLPVTPGQTLYVEVGGQGQAPNATTDTCGGSPCDIAKGGFNGGGQSIGFGGPNWPGYTGGGGGGASDVQTQSMGSDWRAALSSRLIVAGGGGGQGGTAVEPPNIAVGGFGGSLLGNTGSGTAGYSLHDHDLGGKGGAGATSSAGGTGGIVGGSYYGSPGSGATQTGYSIGFAGFDGQLGQGGQGGTTWNTGSDEPGPGGGGGGGYYGGGGGGAGSAYDAHVTNSGTTDAGAGGGGGAGSPHAPPGGTASLKNGGYSAVNGEVIITYATGAGQGGTTGPGSNTGTTTNRTPPVAPEPDLNAACPTIAFFPARLPDAARGEAYAQQIAAYGGTPLYSYSAGQALPAGLALSRSGRLSGTPTATPGMYPVSVLALDSVACANSASYLLRIGPPNSFPMSPPMSTAGGLVTITIRAPDPGTLTARAVTLAAGAARATGKPRSSSGQLYGSARVVVRKAGRVRFTIKPSGAMRVLLRRTHRVRVQISVTFTPAGGTPHTERTVWTVT